MKTIPQKIHNWREQIFADLLTAQGKEYFYQPAVFHVNGIQYRPDFYIPAETIFYEVVGSRQAFHQNRQKIDAVRKAYPFIKIEIVNPDGTPHKARPVRVEMKIGKVQLERWKGRPPIPMGIGQAIRILRDIYEGSSVRLDQLAKDIGVSQGVLSAVISGKYPYLSNHSAFAHKLWVFINSLKSKQIPVCESETCPQNQTRAPCSLVGQRSQ